MKYQRVLYTDKFTEKLKSELRIATYNRRPSSKGNVFYVGFASTSDIEYADRIWKRFRNVTLKPFQTRSMTKAQCKRSIIKHIYKGTLASSSSSAIQSSSSDAPFLSPPMTLTFLSDCQSSSISFQKDSLQCSNETLEERAIRILGPRIKACSDTVSIPTAQPPNIKHCISERNHGHNGVTLNIKEKLSSNMQSSLTAMELARKAANEVRRLYSKISLF